ncbi:Eco57I restriction-modification methylase domain-containing protein [Flavobacterium sp.]|uniref:Eco57I restriction-modification methylase domain-containing protein n=1 Tax=Flavobacterium sp. TaxID=239 RepID=UPI003B9B54CC
MTIPFIQNFSVQLVGDFFFDKISSFRKISEDLNYILTENDFQRFSELIKIGEATFSDASDLLVFTCKYQGILSERSSKKIQFDIAKKVLSADFKDGAIFIFYDENGCFRFSFIRRNYGNKNQKFSSWKRYTYFVDPARTNKTFKNRINGCNFSSLEEIQEAFSVEKLNKKFYEEIATAFYSLIGGKVSINKKEVSFNPCLQLPTKPINDYRKEYQEFGVRLIGRTIFCWFLKNKKSDNGLPLIPEEWLSSKMVASVDNERHDYYHSILEKLFFLILNKKKGDERKPYQLPNNHELVPFLNGGLFEAQADDFFPKDSEGIHQANFALHIPNQWFKDFFEVLEQYNFTIDENSSNDFEVSIDPEMLGTIFENLLAEIDPDTEKSARKSTGSFYTPREIVDYMVEQSLLQYIKTKTNIDEEEKLEILLKDDTENPFDSKQTIAILEALSDVKILDPACGSGAFPMGVLHKIIALLKKLDKGAVWWKAKQLEKIDNAIMRKIMEEKLSSATSDYARKLGVIQHSIYGVDIQPVAAEISKLRSFLSLIIDENINDTAENRGIIPLPNLEFKFVTANTLIGLEQENKEKAVEFDFGETAQLQTQLQKIRNAYLQASPTEKRTLKSDFEKLQQEIYKNELKSGGQNKRAQQLAAWKPFSNESSAWFDPDWMFGVEKFDVVIGNPPYVEVSNKKDKEFFQKLFKDVLSKHYDLYIFFFKIGIDYLNHKGILSYITPHTFTVYTQFQELRNYIRSKTNIIEVTERIENVFETAIVDSSLTFLIKSKSNKSFKTKFTKYLIQNNSLNLLKKSELLQDDYDSTSFDFETIDNYKILKKYSANTVNLGTITHSTQGITVYAKVQGEKKNYFNDSIISKYSKPVMRGKDFHRYEDKWKENFIEYGEWLWCKRDDKFFREPKIFLRQTSADLIATFIEDEFYCIDSVHSIIKNDKNFELKYILSILNSKFGNFLYKLLITESGKVFAQVKLTFLRKLPIKIVESNIQKLIVDKVNKIIENKKQNLDTTELENQIDLMVYKLYELSYAEVLVVDPEFGLSEQEYNSYVY